MKGHSLLSWGLLVSLLAAGLPLFLRMPLWADVTLYDLAARNVLAGGIHYRGVFYTNPPRIVGVHAAVRSLLGWRRFPPCRLSLSHGRRPVGVRPVGQALCRPPRPGLLVDRLRAAPPCRQGNLLGVGYGTSPVRRVVGRRPGNPLAWVFRHLA